MKDMVDLQNHEWHGESEEAPTVQNAFQYRKKEPHMKLIGDKFKGNKMVIKLRKSLWLLVYMCSRSQWTNPWNNNPYGVSKHETTSFSQSPWEHKLLEKKGVLLPCSYTLSCVSTVGNEILGQINLKVWSGMTVFMFLFTSITYLRKKFPTES